MKMKRNLISAIKIIWIKMKIYCWSFIRVCCAELLQCSFCIYSRNNYNFFNSEYFLGTTYFNSLPYWIAVYFNSSSVDVFCRLTSSHERKVHYYKIIQLPFRCCALLNPCLFDPQFSKYNESNMLVIRQCNKRTFVSASYCALAYLSLSHRY